MDQPATSSAAARDELTAMMRQVVCERCSGAARSLYHRTSAKLYGICLRLLGDEGEAQDVLQEVYVTVWNKAASFDASRASPITWLATLARNRAIDQTARCAAGPPGEELDAALECCRRATVIVRRT